MSLCHIKKKFFVICELFFYIVNFFNKDFYWYYIFVKRFSASFKVPGSIFLVNTLQILLLDHNHGL